MPVPTFRRDKSIFSARPCPTDTIQAGGQVGFLQSLLNLPNKHNPFQAFGRYNDVLAHPVYQASYPVSVLTHRYSIVPIRQYRSL